MSVPSSRHKPRLQSYGLKAGILTATGYGLIVFLRRNRRWNTIITYVLQRVEWTAESLFDRYGTTYQGRETT